MRERALRIGKPTPLTAILSEPERTDPNKPAVLILNSGVMHHIGTCRISVRIGRMLASQGFLALRFDYSGIGDSESRRGTEAFEEAALAETREVMDYLERKKGVKRFILYGLCSGADAGYEVAKADERVAGIIQIDAYCYRTPRWYLHHYGPRMLKPAVWGRLFLRIGAGLFRTRAPGQRERLDEEFLEMPSYIREFPPREEVAKHLKAIVGRGVALFNIFTGGQKYILNYENQYRENFPEIDFGDLLTLRYLPDATHIIMEPHYQEQVPQWICEWVTAVAEGRVPELTEFGPSPEPPGVPDSQQSPGSRVGPGSSAAVGDGL